ncbi:MAG: hypothetical protein JSS57_07235 [Proteobacteria bacterium]|nr:hypothetical protein [Pseudomonadota bacterium]
MTEADEIAESLIRKHGNPKTRMWGSAREWILTVWPDARVQIGDQMLSNVAESVVAQAKGNRS